MNVQRVVAAAGLALALMSGVAHATTFDYTGGFQTFVAPMAGTYDITSYGAQGGGADGTASLGGQGAEVGGDFTLTQGEQLTILVGGMGGPGGPGNDITLPSQGGGGGGGSFVYTPIVGIPTFLPVPPYTPLNTYTGYVQLADAAGGGGLGGSSTSFPAGGDGQAGEGPDPGGPSFGTADTAGDGAGYLYGGSNDGGGSAPAFGGQGGVDIAYAGFGPGGDGHGGFGGGGGSGGGEFGAGGEGGGGGGGGYTGGSGGDGPENSTGGYSYLAAGTPKNADYVSLSGVQAGNGLVTIKFVSAVSAAPEPSTWLLMFGGIGGIGLAMRRNKREHTLLAGTAVL